MTSAPQENRSQPLRLNLLLGTITCFVVLSSALVLGTFTGFLLGYWNPWRFYGTPLLVAVLCFVLRLYAWCGWKHLLLSVVLMLLALVVMNCMSGVPFDEPEMYLPFAVLSAIVLIPGTIGILVSRWVASRWNSPKSRRVAVLAAVAVVLCVPPGRWVFWRTAVWHSSSHAALMGPPDLRAAAEDLKRTVVVPTIEQPITQGTNVLWCVTFQLAWNELCALLGEDIHADNAHPMVARLNKETATADDLDEASYVAMAGLVADGIIERIQEALQEKFEGQANPELLPASESLPPHLPIAYAYLFKHLPFEWAFTRLRDPLEFGQTQVASFGIEQYWGHQKNEVKMASQVAIFDYRSDDDFVIELKTRAEEDRLILAKVAPSRTLGETVAGVRQRVATSRATKIEESEDLTVPVLNFDILREYAELYDIGIVATFQQIRFRLDETGAVLKSEAITFMASPPRRFVFDKPFLILLERRGAKNPYFALWVDNAELLVPFDE